jgi:hypothetical protein
VGEKNYSTREFFSHQLCHPLGNGHRENDNGVIVAEGTGGNDERVSDEIVGRVDIDVHGM